MNKTIHITVLALAFLLAPPVIAQNRTVIDAIEMSPSNIILPGSAVGTMTFRPCAGECEAEHKRARLTEDTEYTVNGKRVKYNDFRREFAAIRLDSDSYALVRYATATNTVTNIDIIG